MGWWMTGAVGRRGAIAGAAMTVLASGALLFAFADRSGAAAQTTLTVNLPPPVNYRIYGAPEARGRPIPVESLYLFA